MSQILFFIIIAVIGIILVWVGAFKRSVVCSVAGLCVVIAGLLFLGIAGEYSKFVSIKKEYPVCEATLSLSGKYGSPVYTIAYQDHDKIQLTKTHEIFPTEDHEKLALCEYRFWFITMEKYVFFTNFEELDD